MDDGTFINKIKSLFDEGIFMQLGAFYNEANVITGYGTVDQRLVYAYCQCGPVNAEHAAKIAAMYKMALKMGAPVVAFLDSKGIALDEGVSVMGEYGGIFACQAEAKGIIPQISVITGYCIGTATYIAGLSDFIIMSGKESALMLTSPNTLEGLAGKKLTTADFGNGEAVSGLADVFCDNEALCIERVRELIGHIPSNHLEEAYTIGSGAPKPLAQGETEPYKIIKSVLDGEFFELKKDFAKTVKMGLGFVNGRSLGIIFVNGEIYNDGIDKIEPFIKFCNSFNLPVVTFVSDINGYSRAYDEQIRLIRGGSKLLTAFLKTTVPRINVIAGDVSGSAHLLMNSKRIGCDIVYAWKYANVSLFPKEAYKIIKNEDSLMDAAKKGLIDDIIEPERTRDYLIAALEMLASKRA